MAVVMLCDFIISYPRTLDKCRKMKNKRENKFILFLKILLTKTRSCGILYESSARCAMGDGSAGVAELADARDLKSRDTRVSYRFETGHRHHTILYIAG